MSDKPGEQLADEPQQERGPEGSRDTGSDEPGGGPVDRPADTSDKESDSAIGSQEAEEPDAPYLQSGGN